MQGLFSFPAPWMVQMLLLLVGCAVGTKISGGAGTEYDEELKNRADSVLRDQLHCSIDERNGKTVTQGPDIAVQIECDSENNTVINFRAGDYAENYDLTFAFICTLMNGTELQQYTSERHTLRLRHDQEARYNIPPLVPDSRCLLSGCYTDDFWDNKFLLNDTSTYFTVPVSSPKIGVNQITSAMLATSSLQSYSSSISTLTTSAPTTGPNVVGPSAGSNVIIIVVPTVLMAFAVLASGTIIGLGILLQRRQRARDRSYLADELHNKNCIDFNLVDVNDYIIPAESLNSVFESLDIEFTVQSKSMDGDSVTVAQETVKLYSTINPSPSHCEYTTSQTLSSTQNTTSEVVDSNGTKEPINSSVTESLEVVNEVSSEVGTTEDHPTGAGEHEQTDVRSYSSLQGSITSDTVCKHVSPCDNNLTSCDAALLHLSHRTEKSHLVLGQNTPSLELGQFVPDTGVLGTGYVEDQGMYSRASSSTSNQSATCCAAELPTETNVSMEGSAASNGYEPTGCSTVRRSHGSEASAHICFTLPVIEEDETDMGNSNLVHHSELSPEQKLATWGCTTSPNYIQDRGTVCNAHRLSDCHDVGGSNVTDTPVDTLWDIEFSICTPTSSTSLDDVFLDTFIPMTHDALASVERQHSGDSGISQLSTNSGSTERVPTAMLNGYVSHSSVSSADQDATYMHSGDSDERSSPPKRSSIPICRVTSTDSGYLNGDELFTHLLSDSTSTTHAVLSTTAEGPINQPMHSGEERTPL